MPVFSRLPEESIGRAVAEAAPRLPRRRHRARVAVDVTDLSSGAISNYFARRVQHRHEEPFPWRPWLKWLVVADVHQQLLLSQMARRAPGAASPEIPDPQ